MMMMMMRNAWPLSVQIPPPALLRIISFYERFYWPTSDGRLLNHYPVAATTGLLSHVRNVSKLRLWSRVSPLAM